VALANARSGIVDETHRHRRARHQRTAPDDACLRARAGGAGLFGWALWGELPDLLSLTGVLLVAGAGILSIRLGGRRTAPPAELPDDAIR
jgi:hypothetical protein